MSRRSPGSERWGAGQRRRVMLLADLLSLLLLEKRSNYPSMDIHTFKLAVSVASVLSSPSLETLDPYDSSYSTSWQTYRHYTSRLPIVEALDAEEQHDRVK